MTGSIYNNLNIKEININEVKNIIDNIYNIGVTYFYFEINLNKLGPFFYYEYYKEYDQTFIIYDILKNKILKVARLYVIPCRSYNYCYSIRKFINLYYPLGYCTEFKIYTSKDYILKL